MYVVAQVTKETTRAVMRVVRDAAGNNDRDNKVVQKIRAFVPFREKFIEFLKPLGTQEDYDEYIEDIQEHYDAKLRDALGEDAFQEAARDPNRYCLQLIADFYTQRPDYFLGVTEKESMAEAILHAVRSGVYAGDEYTTAGFSRKWLLAFKPILGDAAYKRFEAELTDISDAG